MKSKIWFTIMAIVAISFLILVIIPGPTLFDDVACAILFLMSTVIAGFWYNKIQEEKN